MNSQLANSLLYPEHLVDLPFLFPTGNGVEIPLIPNGKQKLVTRENCDIYVQKITELLIGDTMKAIINSFVDGMSTILLPQYMSIFSAYELHDLFTGAETTISESDLRENVRVQHGYEKTSPQIAMLFSSILNMSHEEQRLFIRFTTGSDRLPVGGLASLEPKLTVALRNTEIDPCTLR